MEWSWLRDWWRLAKFRRGDRTDPMTAGQRDRRRASGSGAAVSGFTGSALPDIADSMQELEPVRFFVDRLDDSCDDASDDDDAAQRPAVDGEEGEQERRHHYHHPDRHLYFGATDAFYDDPYCDCEKCLNVRSFSLSLSVCLSLSLLRSLIIFSPVCFCFHFTLPNRLVFF